MKVVVAPDTFASTFAGTLGAVEAARAVADGWRRGAPHDDVLVAPMSDGGPGFVDVIHASLGGRLLPSSVTGPLGAPAAATVLLVRADAYVESAQACGARPLATDDRDIWRASSHGVGELVAAAVDAGAARIVVGLGRSVANDGGAGLLAALGAEPAAALRAGPAGLVDLDRLDLGPARRRLAGVNLLVVSDVDNPLLGLRGVTNVFGPQQGASAADVPALDAALTRLAELADRDVAGAKGAGAGGGLGYALLLLGARRAPGFATVADIVGFTEALAGAGLVVTGEGSFDVHSLRATVVSEVAAACAEVGAPCVVLAGRVDVGRREMNANGIEAAYSLADLPGELNDAVRHPAATLAVLAERTARNWSPG